MISFTKICGLRVLQVTMREEVKNNVLLRSFMSLCTKIKLKWNSGILCRIKFEANFIIPTTLTWSLSWFWRMTLKNVGNVSWMKKSFYYLSYDLLDIPAKVVNACNSWFICSSHKTVGCGVSTLGEFLVFSYSKKNCNNPLVRGSS